MQLIHMGSEIKGNFYFWNILSLLKLSTKKILNEDSKIFNLLKFIRKLRRNRTQIANTYWRINKGQKN